MDVAGTGDAQGSGRCDDGTVTDPALDLPMRPRAAQCAAWRSALLNQRTGQQHGAITTVEEQTRLKDRLHAGEAALVATLADLRDMRHRVKIAVHA